MEHYTEALKCRAIDSIKQKPVWANFPFVFFLTGSIPWNRSFRRMECSSLALQPHMQPPEWSWCHNKPWLKKDLFQIWIWGHAAWFSDCPWECAGNFQGQEHEKNQALSTKTCTKSLRGKLKEEAKWALLLGLILVSMCTWHSLIVSLAS